MNSSLFSSLDFSAYSTFTVILMITCTSLLLFCTTLCYCLSHRNQRFPGGPDGDGRKLFRRYREDAFLMQLHKYGNIQYPTPSSVSSPSSKSVSVPSQRTLTIDTVTATADPKVVRSILMSKVHSIDRSWVYRLIANIMPSSDGILFSANNEWKIRHSLFTQLFMSNHIRHYTGEIIIAGIRTCEEILQQQQRLLVSESSSFRPVPKGTPLNTLTPDEVIRQIEYSGNVHEETYGNSEYLMNKVMNTPPTMNGNEIRNTYTIDKDMDRGIHSDLLTMVRWSAVRFLLKYGMNITIDKDSDENSHSVCSIQDGKHLAYVLDAYSRICFEIMPTIERSSSPLVPWFRQYRNLYRISKQLKTILAPIVDKVRSSSMNTSEKPDTPESKNPIPNDNFLTRMVNEQWKMDTIVSEINHLHGAHKAVALLTTCALVELTAHPEARNKVRKELIEVCGEPPQSLSPSERITYIKNLMSKHSQTWDQDTAQNRTEESDPTQSFWRPPSRTDIEKQRLPYCLSVLRETARKHVVSMGTMRKLGEPLDVSVHRLSSSSATAAADVPSSSTPEEKVTLPSSHEIMLLLHAMHHDPVAWGNDAHNWIPERWDRSSAYWQTKLQYQQQQQYPRNYVYNNNQSNVIDFTSLPPEHCFPSYIPDMYVPFLAGTRRCGGMLVAELEFLNYLYVYLVLYDVKVLLPPVITEKDSANTITNVRYPVHDGPANFDTDKQNLGGGVNCTPHTDVYTHPLPCTALAILKDPFETTSVVPNYRYHIVKRSDMFTTIDGSLPYTIGRRTG